MPKEIKLKTKKNSGSVSVYINSIKDDTKRKDAKIVHKLMQELTKDKGKMWGTSIVGYGSYRYERSNGDYGDWMTTGWSSRASNLTLYIMPGYQFDEMKDLLEKLGPHKLGKSCLYIKKLDDIHLPTLKKIIKFGLKTMKDKYS